MVKNLSSEFWQKLSPRSIMLSVADFYKQLEDRAELMN